MWVYALTMEDDNEPFVCGLYVTRGDAVIAYEQAMHEEASSMAEDMGEDLDDCLIDVKAMYFGPWYYELEVQK